MENKSKEEKEREFSKALGAYSLLFQLSLSIIIPLFMCLFLGLYLDKKFNTNNMFTLIFLVLGFFAGIWNMVKVISTFIEKDKKNNGRQG